LANQQKRENISPNLVFLGSKGGGLQLLLSISSILSKKGVSHSIFLSGTARKVWDKLDSGYCKNIYFFDLPHNFSSLLMIRNYWKYLKSLTVLTIIALRSKNEIYVQVMPSPFDRTLDLFAAKRCNRIIRFIHDLEPHLGESWPTNRSISKRIESADKVVCFSLYIQNLIFRKYGFLPDRVTLPTEFFIEGMQFSENLEITEKILVTSKPVVLFIGRGHAYKGLGILQSALLEINERIDFVAAGEGEEVAILKDFGSNYNYWLSDSDFIKHISNSHIVVFPYVEASQSGTIPICRELGKILVITDTGGLVEQVEGYPHVFIAIPGDSESLITQLLAAIEYWNFGLKSKTQSLIRESQSETTADWLLKYFDELTG